VNKGQGERRRTNITLPPNTSDYGTATIPVSVTDDDEAGFVLLPTLLAVAEAGGTGSFTVALASAPTSGVTVTLSVVPGANSGAATLAPNTLAFTSLNWNTAQTVTVTGVDDGVFNAGGKRDTSIVLTASGGGYGSVSASVSVEVTDVPAAGFVLSPTLLDVAEAGGTGSFTVALANAPTGDVTVTLFAAAGANSGALTLDTDSGTAGDQNALTFTSSNWGMARTVTVTGVNDDVDNTGDKRDTSIALTATGGGYGSVTGSLPVSVTDDDDPPAGISLTVSPSSVTEGAGSTAITVTATVQGNTGYGAAQTLTLGTTDGTAGSLGGSSGRTDFNPVPSFQLMIAAGAQTGTATFNLTPRPDDSVPDSDRTFTVTGVASPAGVTVTPATVTITDDDGQLPIPALASGSTTYLVANSSPTTGFFAGLTATWGAVTNANCYILQLRDSTGASVIGADVVTNQLTYVWNRSGRDTIAGLATRTAYKVEVIAARMAPGVICSQPNVSNLALRATGYLDSDPTCDSQASPNPCEIITPHPAPPIPPPDHGVEISAAMQSALSARARGLLDDASDVISRRMALAEGGEDAPTAFADLLAGAGRADCAHGGKQPGCPARAWPGGPAPAFGPGTGRFGRAAGNDGSADLSGLRDLVRQRGFAVSLSGTQESPGGGGEGTQLAFWGDGGADDALWWGVDARRGDRWMAGISWAGSRDAVDRRELAFRNGSVSGSVETDVSAVYPYMRGRLGEGFELWSVVGRGGGRVDSAWEARLVESGRPELRELRLQGDLVFDMGVVGAKQRLWQDGGVSVTAVGDAGWARLAAVGGTADGIAAAVSRARLGLEGRRAPLDGAWAWGLRVGGRADGGDGGDTGSGVEASGDLSRALGRYELSAEGRWHGAGAGISDVGVRTSFGMLPRADGGGLSFTLSPGYGTADPAGAADGHLPGFRPTELSAGRGGRPAEAAARLEALVSWGRLVPGLTPGREDLLDLYGELSHEERASSRVRLGARLGGGIPLGVAMDWRKRESGGNEVGLLFGGEARF